MCRISLLMGRDRITCLPLWKEPPGGSRLPLWKEPPGGSLHRGKDQTTRHVVEECPLTAFPGGLRRLHEAGPDAVEWLSRLSMKL